MQTKQQFSEVFLTEIRGLLESERVRLEGEVEKSTNKNHPIEDGANTTFPEYGDEEDDNAREVAEYAANRQLEDALEKELRDVIKALNRIAEGSYGICKYCDQPIDEKRLIARPTSGACVSCKKTLTDEV